MHDKIDQNTNHLLRVGSLFSGYGGLDLAVESVFNARTVWYSEINEPVARVFAHHWPDAPNLGDITAIVWSSIPPVDILCGGFPCQDVSTVGKRAGLRPGTRSGLWTHMAAAIDVLRPQWVVIENVRGLLTAPAANPVDQGEEDDRCNPDATTAYATPGATPRSPAVRDLEPSTWHLGDSPTRPGTAAGAVLGTLASLGYDAAWIGLPASLIGAAHQRFRVFILAWPTVPASTGIGRGQGQRDTGPRPGTTRNRRAEPPSDRPRSSANPRSVSGHARVDRGSLRRWGRYAPAIARWEHITGRPAPAPAILTESSGPRPSPEFVEWLMGLESGWVTDPGLGLTHAQQLTALGNGVMPTQAKAALARLLNL
jgi:DNA (cytosine-5)-methyltransferase 1